jgi:dipeptidyl aminopeptidase/acylaminoacyl peptidase
VAARIMRAWGVAAIALAALAGLPCAAAPLEAYGKLPFLEQVAISPDGKMLALVTTDGEHRKLAIERAGSRQVVLQLNLADRKLRDVQWAGSRHVIVTTSQTGQIPGIASAPNEWFVAVDVDWTRNTQRPLLWGVPQALALNVIEGPPEFRSVDGKPFAFVRGLTFVARQGRMTLIRIDLDAGKSSILAQGFPFATDFVVDAEGHALAKAGYDAVHEKWSLDLWKEGQWREVDSLDAPIDTPDLKGLGRDGASVAVAFRSDNRPVLRELRPDGAWSDPIPLADPDRLIWDATTHRLLGEGALIGEEERFRFFDQQDQKAWDWVRGEFPGARLDLRSFTDDHKTFVVHVDSGDVGPAYFLADAASRTTTPIGAEYPALAPGDIAPVRPIAFKAADGLPLTGYLTLPRGKEPKKLPLVVFPHGGPAARDQPGFDWWAQAMASRGYAVLQVNYRGSAGLGWAFQSAGFGQWGRKMQTDLSDGVRFLAAQGTIDPALVCIVGASYGGYAALTGAAFDTGVYRCAASIAGPSALASMIQGVGAREGPQGAATQRYWTRYMGQTARLDEISPASHADKVAIPILLVHGRDDTVVDYRQSQFMADALAKAGKPFDFVTLEGEDHWLSRGATRFQMLRAVVNFLEKNNPPG